MDTKLEEKLSNEELTKIVLQHLENNVPSDDIARERSIAMSLLQRHAQKEMHSYAVLDFYNIADQHYN